ncbi:phospholipase C [Sarocladium strictum]
MAPPPRHPRRFDFLLILPLALLSTYIFYTLLSLRTTICLHGGPNCHRGFRSAYSFDAASSHHPTWMKAIPDDTNLTSLSIPGTHDTMTYEIENQRLECQNWNMSVQMQAGVRYFDIRARLKDDELRIYHTSGYTGFSFEDVLLRMCGFLEENPSEAIIMRLKEEGGPLGHNTVTFEEAFNSYRDSRNSTKSCIADHLYLHNNTDTSKTATIPTLGDLRSKIFLLQNFKAPSGKSYGLTWSGPQMQLEDFWIMPDASFLPQKWEAIHKAIKLANDTPLNNELLYLAHISASVGVLPIEAAAGTADGKVDGMNDVTGSWLEENVDEAVRTGIVIFDFPGKKAIDAVLSWNPK